MKTRTPPQDIKFNRSGIPVAMLLEGTFNSVYRNRITNAQLDSLRAAGGTFIEKSRESKMILVADGDVFLNDVSPNQGPLPMGLNFYTVNTQYEYQFANRDFLLNCIEYLVNKPGIIETRNKDIVLRLLDPQKVEAQRSTWQFINIGAPILLILLFGWFYQQLRKRRYAGT